MNRDTPFDQIREVAGKEARSDWSGWYDFADRGYEFYLLDILKENLFFITEHKDEEQKAICNVMHFHD